MPPPPASGQEAARRLRAEAKPTKPGEQKFTRPPRGELAAQVLAEQAPPPRPTKPANGLPSINWGKQ
jgi:hypothetical protein